MSKEIEGGVGKGGMNPHWEVKLDTVKSCSKGATKKVVWIGRLAKVKIDILMKKFKNQEWFAYLLGEDNRVKDIFLPEQKASQAFVGDIECREYNKLPVIGAMHSHHSMNMDMSGHDHDFVNSNHDISLLVNSRRGISGQVRIKVPCGALYITEADVRLDLEVDGFNKKDFLSEIDEKINKKKKEKKSTPPNYQRTYPQHSRDCTCVMCSRDRDDWMNQKRTTKKTWDTEEISSTAEVEFEGAWICEECSRINYMSKDDKEIKECVWCESPIEEKAPEEQLTMKDLEEEFDDLDAMLKGEFKASAEVEEAMAEKFTEVMDKIRDEKILENAVNFVSKYLVLAKNVFGEEGYKKDLDSFADELSAEWDEEEDSIRDDIESTVMLLEEKVEALIKMRKEQEEKEEENSEK